MVHYRIHWWLAKTPLDNHHLFYHGANHRTKWAKCSMANSEKLPDLVGGWAEPLWKMLVNWDDWIPNISGKIKNGNQTTNQWWSCWDWRLLVKPGLPKKAFGFFGRTVLENTQTDVSMSLDVTMSFFRLLPSSKPSHIRTYNHIEIFAMKYVRNLVL